jgi:hypothetical protein
MEPHSNIKILELDFDCSKHDRNAFDLIIPILGHHDHCALEQIEIHGVQLNEPRYGLAELMKVIQEKEGTKSSRSNITSLSIRYNGLGNMSNRAVASLWKKEVECFVQFLPQLKQLRKLVLRCDGTIYDDDDDDSYLEDSDDDDNDDDSYDNCFTRIFLPCLKHNSSLHEVDIGEPFLDMYGIPMDYYCMRNERIPSII